MIVSCPSCQTRYRHAETLSRARLGRCSHCDETVDLTRRLRQYVVLPVGRSLELTGALPTHLPVGMDDPSLAPQIESSGRAVGMVIPPSESRAQPRPRAALGLLREWFGLFLLTALGASGGFHGSVIVGQDPVIWTAAGTVGGLILGWSWIRSAERKR